MRCISCVIRLDLIPNKFALIFPDQSASGIIRYFYKMKSIALSLSLVLFCCHGSVNQAKQTSKSVESAPLDISKINLPPGFKIEIYAEGVENARSLALSPNGTLFVGTRSKGNVYALKDMDSDEKAETQYILAKNMNMPNGVAFREGDLYVAEVDRVLKYENIEADLSNTPEPVVINDDFPEKKHHGWKYIAFGPDDKLYVPVGAPCNICESEERIFNTITRLNPMDQGWRLYMKEYGIPSVLPGIR